jgi:hypothetical protein
MWRDKSIKEKKLDYALHEEYKRLKDNPNYLFSDINFNNKRERRQLLIELNQKENFDICEYAVKAIEDGLIDAFYMNSLLGDIISELKLNKESLYNYLKLINKSLQNNIFNSTQYIQIMNIIQKQPDFTYEFLNYLLTINEPVTYQYIAIIILYHDHFNNNNKHSHFLSMIASNSQEKIILGIFGLGRINYSVEYDQNLLNSTLSCFVSLLKQENHIINGQITNSLGFLYILDDKFLSLLIDLSKRDDPYILFEISQLLNYDYEKIKNNIYFKKLLFSLSKVKSEYLGIIKDIDFLLLKMLDTEEQLNLVLDFILQWITDSDCKPDIFSSHNFLDMTLSTIYKNINLRQKMLIYLLINEIFFAPILASYIISSNWLQKDYDVNFSSDTLVNLNNNDIFFICRRILGFFNLPEIIVQLFSSILIIKIENKEIVNYIYYIFIGYIGYNYLQTTIDFFTGVLSSTKSDLSYYYIIKNILNKLKKIEKERIKRQRLKEFEPSRKDNYLLYRNEWITTQKTLESSKKNSSLQSLIPKVYIKYGKGYSSQIDKDITEPSQFKTISSSIELAYDSIIDPIRFNFNKSSFQRTKRNENCE